MRSKQFEGLNYYKIEHTNGERKSVFRCITDSQMKAIDKMYEYYNCNSMRITDIKTKLFSDINGTNAFMTEIAKQQLEVINERKRKALELWEKRKAKREESKQFFKDLANRNK